MMINASNTLQQSHKIMKKLENILKDYQQFKLLQMNVIEKEQITHQKKMIRKKIEKNNLMIALNVLYAKNEKIQLTIAISFISSKDNNEERVIHLKCDNIEIMIKGKADEVIKEYFQSLLSRYQ